MTVANLVAIAVINIGRHVFLVPIYARKAIRMALYGRVSGILDSG
jgi:hypothetical protein